jgi:hypothetical protein
VHRRGSRLHCSSLPADEITIRRGIPVTTVPRTLLDLATVLPANQLQRAFHEAEEHLLPDPLSLPDLLARHPGRHGTPAIRALLEATAEVSAWLHVRGRSFECDFLWRDTRLIAELDGRAWHDTALAFERDRARDRRLAARGWRVIRLTWRQLQRDATALAAGLRTVLHRQSL